MPGAAAGREPRDRGTPLSLALAWVIVILAFGLVASLQAIGASAAKAPPTPDSAIEPAAQPAPPEITFRLTSRLSVLMLNAAREGDPAEFDRARAAGELQTFETLVTDAAVSWEDRLRLAAVVADILGPERGLERIARVEQLLAERTPDEPPPPAGFDDDVRAFREALAGHTLDDERRQRFVERHGWFAELALVADRPLDDPAKDELLAARWMVLVLGTAFVIVFGVLVFAGCALLVTALILRLLGRLRPRFIPPAPGGSVYLETFGAFVLGFLVLSAAVDVVFTPPAGWEWTRVAMQWALLPLAAWPLLRGVPWPELRRAIGLHAGRGVAREVLCGVAGYAAALPVLIAGVLITALLTVLWSLISGSEPHPPHHAPADLISQGDTATLIALGSLVVLWAPLVEECVFRGALYRHFRGRLAGLPSGLLSAGIFAFMHGYGVLFTPPLIALGLVFAWLREWRGSLIAPIVAHMIQNSIAFTLMMVLFR